MPLRFVKNNILKIPCDIIVNPSDGVSFTESKISQDIERAAGKEYSDAITQIQPFSIGDVVFTESGNLSYKYVAHVALPDWYGGKKNE